jgi:predicted permease
VNALPTILPIFILLLVGYGARRFGVLKPGDAATVNSIITYLTLPAFIFTAIYGKKVTTQMVSAPIVVLIATMVVMGLAYLCARALNLDRRTTGGLILAATFGNTGFMGYPLTLGAFPGNGQAIATSVMVDQFSMTLPLFSIGIVIAASFASTEFSKWQVLEFVRNPVFPSAIVALALKSVHIPVPIMSSLTYLGAATVPLAMISLGLSLRRLSMKAATVPFLVAFILKMIALPVLTFFGLKVAGVGGVVHDAAVLEASMPTAIMAGVIAGRYGANGAFVAGTTFLMILLSLITIPATLMLLH